GRGASVERHRVARPYPGRAHREARPGRLVPLRRTRDPRVRPIGAVVGRRIDGHQLETHASYAQDVHRDVPGRIRPGHHAAFEELVSVPPDLENHAPAVADLTVHANVRREIRTTRVRTELDGGRGVGPQALRIPRPVQGESPTIARTLPPVAHVPFDRPELVRHV